MAAPHIATGDWLALEVEDTRTADPIGKVVMGREEVLSVRAHDHETANDAKHCVDLGQDPAIDRWPWQDLGIGAVDPPGMEENAVSFEYDRRQEPFARIVEVEMAVGDSILDTKPERKSERLDVAPPRAVTGCVASRHGRRDGSA